MDRRLEVSFLHGLQRPSVLVVKGVVKKEDVAGAEVDHRELAAKLLECMRSEAAGNEAAEVLAA